VAAAVRDSPRLLLGVLQAAEAGAAVVIEPDHGGGGRSVVEEAATAQARQAIELREGDSLTQPLALDGERGEGDVGHRVVRDDHEAASVGEAPQRPGDAGVLGEGRELALVRGQRAEIRVELNPPDGQHA
jgi:hypothetical protein